MVEEQLTRIGLRIAATEEKLHRLRITERTLLDLLRDAPARAGSPIPAAQQMPGIRQFASQKRLSIPGLIVEALSQQQPLSVPQLSDHIARRGKKATNRAISFSLQALKRRGLLRSSDGEWRLR